MIKKALLVILACVMASQASANTRGYYSTGNDWLWQIQSDHAGTKVGAAAHLSGMNRMHMLAGLLGECATEPDGVSYGQVEALVIKWLEDNIDKRHQFLPVILHNTKKEAWGSYPLPRDKPIC